MREGEWDGGRDRGEIVNIDSCSRVSGQGNYGAKVLDHWLSLLRVTDDWRIKEMGILNWEAKITLTRKNHKRMIYRLHIISLQLFYIRSILRGLYLNRIRYNIFTCMKWFI